MGQLKNFRKFLLVFILVSLLFFPLVVHASATTLYPTTVTHPAYENAQVTTAINVYASPDRATSEMSSGEYSNVQSENAVYASTTTSTSTNLRYACGAQLFTFDTSVISGTITDIVLYWKGYVTQPDGGEGVSAILQYFQGSWKDWSNPAPSSNTEKTKDIGDGTGYFYSTTWLRFGVCATNLFLTGDSKAYVHLYTDYAAIVVTYTLGQNYVTSLADNVQVTDSIAKQIKKAFAETLQVTDSIAKKITKAFSETIQITDSLSKHIMKALTDTVIITYTLASKALHSIFTLLIDAITISDAIATSIGISKSSFIVVASFLIIIIFAIPTLAIIFKRRS